MVEALKQSGHAPVLVQNKPWEAFAVIWLGLPALITLFGPSSVASAPSVTGSYCRSEAFVRWTGPASQESNVFKLPEVGVLAVMFACFILVRGYALAGRTTRT